MDSDDFWPKNKLEKQLNEMLKMTIVLPIQTITIFTVIMKKTLN